MPAVSFQAISKTFATPKGPFQALNQVNLDIEEGEFFGLLGPNGAGKTTLISILAGLARATSGRVLVQGSDVQAQYADARRKLGIVPQELVFDPFFNVREALRIQSGYFGVKNNDAWIDELLENLGLADKANANMRQLSGGMNQRVMIAMAIACNPRLLIADEPTTALDVTIQAQILDLMRRLQEKLGMAIVFITHDLGIVAETANRVVVMYAGQVVEAGSVAQIFSKPLMPYTAGLLQSVPRMGVGEVKTRLSTIPGYVPLLTKLPSGCRFRTRCAFATEACAEKEPALEVIEGDRSVRCIRWRELDLQTRKVPA
eukprot:gene42519-biopygen34149